jgi:hypothetical protein
VRQPTLTERVRRALGSSRLQFGRALIPGTGLGTNVGRIDTPDSSSTIWALARLPNRAFPARSRTCGSQRLSRPRRSPWSSRTQRSLGKAQCSDAGGASAWWSPAGRPRRNPQPGQGPSGHNPQWTGLPEQGSARGKKQLEVMREASSHGIPPMVPRRSDLRAVRPGLAWRLLKASRFCPWRKPVGRPVSIDAALLRGFELDAAAAIPSWRRGCAQGSISLRCKWLCPLQVISSPFLS